MIKLLVTFSVMTLSLFIPLNGEQFPTYFSYSSLEIECLGSVESHFSITESSLKKWDKIASDLAEKDNLGHYFKVRLFTYLYVAQKEAAFLAYNATQKFTGSLDPISYAILNLFFPKVNFPTEISSDPFSEKLANIVLPHFRDKFEKEQGIDLEFKVNPEMSQRKETNYTLGSDVAKWIPWAAIPEVAYWPKAPPSDDGNLRRYPGLSEQ